MDCPFCAESIKEAAVLCRFCGARKEGEAWQPPQPAARPPAQTAQPARPAGSFTMRSAAACFLISGVFELVTIQDAVPLAGALRSGAAAIAYHLVYAGLFVALGIGLWGGWRWGYRVVWGATAFYTLDRAIYLLDSKVLDAQAAELTRMSSGLISKSMVLESIQVMALATLACWWGFALYVFLRRAYFRQHDSIPVAESIPEAEEPAADA